MLRQQLLALFIAEKISGAVSQFGHFLRVAPEIRLVVIIVWIVTARTERVLDDPGPVDTKSVEVLPGLVFLGGRGVKFQLRLSTLPLQALNLLLLLHALRPKYKDCRQFPTVFAEHTLVHKVSIEHANG